MTVESDQFQRANMTTGHLSSRYGLLLILAPTVAFAVFFGAIGYSFKASQVADLIKHHNVHVLERSLDIANEQAAIIGELSAPVAACSAADLVQMRERVFRSKYVGDIARITDGVLQCSAIWGRWEEPYALPAQRKALRQDIYLWRQLKNPIHPSFSGDVAANDHVAVFSGPSAFVDVEAHSGHLWGRTFSRDGGLIQEFGAHPPAEAGPGMAARLASAFTITRTGSACSPPGEPDVCVASVAQADARLPVLVTGLLGAGVGAACGVALFLWWRGANGLRVSLGKAIRREKIQVRYQPLCSLATGEMVGVEALARWTHDEVGPIPPDTFIPWIESMGLRRVFTRYIIRHAIEGVKDRLAGVKPFYLSVNVFAADLEDETFLDFLAGCVKDGGVPPERIAIEVTESAKFSSATPAELISRFRRAGFKVLLDDFGVGYSSLGSVLQWDVSGIKLDRIFVQSIVDDSNTNPVLDHVIEMAKKLDVQLIVEGLETRAQVEYVSARAPRAVGQGWFFGRPMSVDELDRAAIGGEAAARGGPARMTSSDEVSCG
ncbi:EAL domain-containing protein [Achromobacter xylosoxidans]